MLNNVIGGSDWANNTTAKEIMPEILAWREYNFERVRDGQLFFYAGAGLSQSAGLVGWNGLTASISRFRREYEGDKLDGSPKEDDARKNADYLRNFVEQEGADGEPILSLKSNDDRTFPRTAILNFLLRSCGVQSGSSGLRMIEEDDLRLHGALWKTQCQGVLTTNYDMLFEDAFGLIRPSERSVRYGHLAAIRTYRYYAEFLPFVLSVPRFVLKMHGDINDIGTMLFDPETAWERGNALGDVLGGNLCRVFDAVLRSGHLVYIGCGGRDRTFRELHRWDGRTKYSPHQRLFFAFAAEVPGIIEEMGSAVEDVLFLTYGSRGEKFDGSYATTELREFLRELARFTKRRPHNYSEEAASLWHQLGGELSCGWFTPNWSVSGVPRPKSWNQGSPQAPGLYLWRRRYAHARPFLARVGEKEDWFGEYLSVRLEGRDICWRYDKPWAVNGKPPDEEFTSFEWAEPPATWGDRG